MNEEVANRDLCVELHELTGWKPPYMTVRKYRPDGSLTSYDVLYNTDHVPAYTLSFLLRKLPAYINHEGGRWFWMLCREVSGRKWQTGFELIKKDDFNDVMYPSVYESPEDAVCRLVIMLIRDGIIKKEVA